MIPRMKGWVNNNYPGTKLAVSDRDPSVLRALLGAVNNDHLSQGIRRPANPRGRIAESYTAMADRDVSPRGGRPWALAGQSAVRGSVASQDKIFVHPDT